MPKEKIIIYIVTNSTAKSNMSGRYSAYLIKDNKPYCLLSWNVDGYSDSIHSWLGYLLVTSRPDVVFLSETKRKHDKLKFYFDQFTEYNYIINAHIPSQYHGVVALIRKDRTFIPFNIDLNIPARSDTKSGNPVTGRVIVFNFEDEFIVVGTYVPTSTNLEKLQYRVVTWDPALTSLLNVCRQIKPTVWLGDINVAPSEIDVSHPSCSMIGFSPEERASFAKFISLGDWIDIWRYQHPTTKEYSWKGYTPKQGFGMRIDNIVISKELLKHVNGSFIMGDCILSDHVPIGVYINKH